jgi:hypothetical protein
MEDVKVTALFPAQRCTVASVAGHAMYERANPFTEYVLGGRLDMSQCVYEQFDERTSRITGPRFVPAEELRVNRRVRARWASGLSAWSGSATLHHRADRCRD